jgi:predicted nucleic acid-binding Zn ribbon protein
LRRAARPHAIGDAVRSIRARAEPATQLAAVQSAWGRAVGARIAREAQPVRERDGQVTVACRASTWAQELDLLQAELLERLNESLRRGSVDSLRFVVDPQRFEPDTDPH